MRWQWRGRRALATILWASAFFLGLQIAFNIFVEIRQPEIYDPEYRDRLVVLRQRTQENPDRPLFLVVGSSRFITGFSPECLPPIQSPVGERPLVFNLSHTCSGPLLNLLMVRRLLREGFHPRWMVVEVVPPLLASPNHSAMARLSLRGDLPILERYMSPWKSYGWYIWERSMAHYNHRRAFLRHAAPWLLLDDASWDYLPLQPLGGKTWQKEPGPAEVVQLKEITRKTYYSTLQQLRISETGDRALREILDLCRQQSIPAALLLTPEAKMFRDWYPADAPKLIGGYCADLAGEYGVPMIDAREWLADDDFSDGHHVLPRGATKFTLRLGSDVLQPLVDGRLQQYGLSTQPAPFLQNGSIP